VSGGLLKRLAVVATTVHGGDGWLHWDAPPQCPNIEDVTTRIEHYVGAVAEDPSIEVDAKIDGEGLRLRLQTRISGRDEVREVTAESCETLADVVALIVAVSIDPVRTVTQLPDPSEYAASTTLAPTEDIEAGLAPGEIDEPMSFPSAPVTEPPGARALEIELAAAGGVDFGSTAAVSGGPRLGVALRWPRVIAALDGFYIVPRLATRTDPTAQVLVHLGAAQARTCFRAPIRRVDLQGCGAVELGAQRGDGRLAPGSRVAHALWVAVAAAVGLRVPLTRRLAFSTMIEAVVPVRRPAFELGEGAAATEVFRSPSVVARIWIGLSWIAKRRP